MPEKLRKLYQADARKGRRIAREIMLDEEQPAAARMRAIEFLTDRAWGKVPQALEHSGPDGSEIPMVDPNTAREKLKAEIMKFLTEATKGKKP